MTPNFEKSIKIILDSYKNYNLTEDSAITLIKALFETSCCKIQNPTDEKPYKIYTSPFPYDDGIMYTTHTYNNGNTD